MDVVGRTGTAPPAQITKLPPKLNTGVIFGLTVTVKFIGVAHCPAAGVNVYTPVFWLSTTEGFQVPVIPLSDVVGRVGTAAPEQIVKPEPKLKAGVIFGLTVTVKVIDVAHCPAVGVNV